MYISERCAECLFDKQKNMTADPGYLEEIRSIIDNRRETDTSPYLVYLFNQVYERRFGAVSRYGNIKKKYNDLALSLEAEAEKRIEEAEDPLAEAIAFARVGNYIDFGAMNSVDPETFLSLFKDAFMSDLDLATYSSFLKQCETAERFLLIADNCGEIVFDKLMIRQLKKRFPDIKVKVLVRGGEVLNDASAEDAAYVGIDREAEIISNGNAVAGTIYELLTDEAKQALDEADVVLSKGQGNYESLSRQGRHVFYSFLCKCDLFMERYSVPKLTGMFVEEN